MLLVNQIKVNTKNITLSSLTSHKSICWKEMTNVKDYLLKVYFSIQPKQCQFILKSQNLEVVNIVSQCKYLNSRIQTCVFIPHWLMFEFANDNSFFASFCPSESQDAPLQKIMNVPIARLSMEMTRVSYFTINIKSEIHYLIVTKCKKTATSKRSEIKSCCEGSRNVLDLNLRNPDVKVINFI